MSHPKRSIFSKYNKPEVNISSPENFRHASHVGYDTNDGFQIQNIPAPWTRLFQSAGVTTPPPPQTPLSPPTIQKRTLPPPPPPYTSLTYHAPYPPSSSAPPPPPPTTAPPASSPSLDDHGSLPYLLPEETNQISAPPPPLPPPVAIHQDDENTQLLSALTMENSQLIHTIEELKQQITESQKQKKTIDNITVESIKTFDFKQIQELEVKLRADLQIIERRKQELMTKDSDQKHCIVCTENDKDMVFIPCGHLCCCSECAQPIELCPICRKTIQQKVKTFI